jgi:hypothetical protein
MAMSWYEHAIRRYEHRRWTTDDNRMVRLFEWGLEHINGSAARDDPRAFVRQYAQDAIAKSDEWYSTRDVRDYHLDENNVLTFTSTVESPWPENNTVHAQFFPGKKIGPAVLILPNWNAKWHGQVALCHWLQRMGISAMKMSLPYHDRRMAKGHERADQLVGPNIGLTLHANRQAVQDARACLSWLEQRGYHRLGILGTSIGSSVGYITLVHDKRVRAGGFFHVSTYFADVVSQGMTTNHVWEGLRHEVSVHGLRKIRPDIPAGTDPRNALIAATARRRTTHTRIAGRALFTGIGAVQLHRRISHVHLFPRSPGIRREKSSPLKG